MATHTIKLLEEGADKLRRHREQWDPELREWVRREEMLRQDFFQRHRQNPALRRQVLELLDAAGAIGCLEQEFFFRLGLQMGLELGALEVFPPE